MSDERTEGGTGGGAGGTRDRWRLAFFVLLGGIVAILAAGVVIAQRGSAPAPDPAGAAIPQLEEPARTAETPAARPRAARSGSESRIASASERPRSADVEDCNRYAASRRNRALDTAKKALVGGALGAALGAAGGAIADGGDGAGKGAAIGGLAGVAAGTLYGINQNNRTDGAAQAAYRACMERRGYL